MSTKLKIRKSSTITEKPESAGTRHGSHADTIATKRHTTEAAGIALGLERFLDALPFYVLLIDEDHRILAANKAVRKDLGVDPAQIVGKYCPKVIHGLDHPFPGCPLEEAVAGNDAVKRELFDATTRQWMKIVIYPTGVKTSGNRAIFIHMAYDITKRKNTEEEVKRNYSIQAVTNSLLRLSLKDVPLERLLEQALDLILSIPWLAFESRGAIFLVEDDPDVLIMKAQNGLAEPIKKACARIPFGKCLCGRAAATRETQFAECLDDRHEISYAGITAHGHYCVPIMRNHKILGVINMYLRAGHREDPKEKEFLAAVANTLAGIIKRTQMENELKRSFERWQKAFEETIRALISATEMRDPYTAGHQQRVSELARAIAREMNLSEDQITAITMAATIHDIGKIQVPAEILTKPGQLNEIEFSLIKTHPQVGHDILRHIEFPWPIADIVLQHHEREDGSGYPRGLSDKDILLEAKILAVADVVEAMASHRPYRPARGIDQALQEISRNKGKLYDVRVVDACLELFRKKFEFK